MKRERLHNLRVKRQADAARHHAKMTKHFAEMAKDYGALREASEASPNTAYSKENYAVEARHAEVGRAHALEAQTHHMLAAKAHAELAGLAYATGRTGEATSTPPTLKLRRPASLGENADRLGQRRNVAERDAQGSESDGEIINKGFIPG